MKYQTTPSLNGRLGLAVISILVLLAACSTEDMAFDPSKEAIENQGTQDEEPTEQPSQETTEEAPTYIQPTPATQTTPPGNDGAIDELNCATTREEIKFHWGTDSGDGFENSIYGPYLLNDARTGVHADYDRFVLEFEPDINEPDGSPDSFHVFWADGTPLSMGSGDPISVSGTNALEVFVLGYGYARDESAEPSQAPQSLSPTRTGNLKQAVWDGEFEGVLHWVLGVQEKVDFRVLSIPNPPRLVVDVCRTSSE